MTPATVRDDYAIVLDGFEEFQAALQHLGDGSGAVGREIETAMQAALDVLGQQIDARTPVNIGALQASRSSDVYGTAMQMFGVTMTPLAYGWPMERGRAAGKMPPVDALEYWVKRKGVTFAGKTPRQTAWIIARAIAKGTTQHQRKGGDKMYLEGTAAARPYVERIFDDLVDRLLQGLTQ
jgi:hypothetical protein